MKYVILLFTGIFFFDQALKAFAKTHAAWWQGAFFRLTENEGIAFSVPLPPVALWMFVGGAAVGVTLFFFYCMRAHRTRDCVVLALIGGGGASNIVDRLRFGAVTDIFSLPGGLLLNVADLFILLGVFLLFILRRSSTPRGRHASSSPLPLPYGDAGSGHGAPPHPRSPR